MSNFNKTQGFHRLEQQGFTPHKEKTSRSSDGRYSSRDGEKKKQEQADQQSDAGPRRYEGGDIYRKNYMREDEKSNRSR
ncbi:hypothetical protein EJD96_11785 [Herbaspirillum seropedicae]|uniref:hypothetical protein n=1 Tax=Herbaspirillum seropedicae TaxID=964 RepID=UPI00111E1F39|nr:hypothetical protein [Herbaspirillum seropedicae]QDD64795.1 hypothetical protein EJD96_11785 [Herbaspirillum seropedicae]